MNFSDVSCYGLADGSIDISPSSFNSTGTICGTADQGFDLVLTAPVGAIFSSVSFAS